MIKTYKPLHASFYFVDLFCGAGGTSTGMYLMGQRVVACVNHDKNAIKSHKMNHPFSEHFNEDIRDFKVVEKIKKIVETVRANDSMAVIVLWASLECTNFSLAKGGLPRDLDSRSLADHMPMYIDAINPDIFAVENVKQFADWGPLNPEGKPDKSRKGEDYLRWTEDIKSRGYELDQRLLCSADYGAHQERERLFVQFSRIGIRWPEVTHVDGGSETKKGWNPVSEVLDLNDHGKSIFQRKKPLVENTLRRILYGLEKFVAPRFEDNFTLMYYGKGKARTNTKPSATVTTNDRFAKVQVLHSPFVDVQNSSGRCRSVDKPSATLTSVNKQSLVTPQFIINPQFNDKGRSTDRPCCTLIARMDKSPLSLASVDLGETVKINPDDSPMTVKIKEFMNSYGLSDIKTRMFSIKELKLIQGFDEDYELVGTQAEQKKFIGNAVEVKQAKAIVKALVDVEFKTVEEFNGRAA